MASKRMKSDTKRDAKRVKTDDVRNDYEVVLRGDTYIDVDKLFKCAKYQSYFKKHYNRSVQRLIDDENLDVIYATNKGVQKGELIVKTSYAPRSDVRLVKKDANIEQIIELAKNGSHGLVPSVIEDEDLVFFVDKDDVQHQVEMRGERTRKGIYFKAKDVGRVFQQTRFVETVLDPRNSYQEGMSFVRFEMPKKVNVNEQREEGTRRPSKELFLTCNGFFKACYTNRTLTCRQPYGERYLIHLGDRLYKFGKSSNIKQRIKNHEAYFSVAEYDDIEHVYSAKVDIDKLSAAETAVRKFLQANDWYRSTKVLTELCELGDGDLEQVKYFYDQLQVRDFSGVPYSPPVDVWKSIVKLFESLSVDDDMLLGLKQPVTIPINTPKHAEEIQDSKCACELHIKDLETQIEKLRYENAQLKAAAEIGALQQINEAQSSRIRRLEELVKVKILCPW